MKQIWGALAAGAMLSIAQPVLADVKAGVDAWQQGDYDRAVAQWRPLAESGDADAQFNMGQAYKLGRGVKADMRTAMDWYRKAAAQGHARAEDNLGLLMFRDGDRAGALPYLQQSAARGEPRAQYIVGTALFNGDLLSKDWVRAYALMTQASASGLAQATASLKQMDKYIPEDQRLQGRKMAGDMRDQSVAVAQAEPVRVEPPAARVTAQDSKVPVATPKAAAPVKTTKPKPAPVKAASVKPPAPSGGWRVQLGAFSEEGRARALWSRLSGKVNGLSAYQLYLVKGGAMTRLQAGPLASAAEAARLCGAIKAAGADCMPRKM